MKKPILAAFLVSGAIAVAGCGGDDTAAPAPAESPPPATDAVTQTEPPPAAETAVEPAPSTAEVETETAAEPPATVTGTVADAETPPPDGPGAVTIRLARGDVAGGEKTIEVKKGDLVRIRVLSDRPDEVHLHGYDIEKAVAPGNPAVFRFEATFEGIFEMEAHEIGGKIAELVVRP